MTAMAEEIVPTPDQDSIFKQLEDYNWDKDKEYQGGLSAILGPSPSPSQIYDLTLRAQCFYMSRKNGTPIDFNAYKAYLSSKIPHSDLHSSTSNLPSPSTQNDLPSSQSPTIPPPQLQDLSINPTATTSAKMHPQNLHNVSSESQPTTQPTTTPLPPLNGSWQLPNYTAPLDLHPDRPRPAALTSRDLLSQTPLSSSNSPAPAPIQTTYTDPTAAPYPATFSEIIALIQSGAPIPGIKDIPQETAWGAGGEQTLRVRRKPWEMHLTEEEVQVGYTKTFGDRRDDFVVQDLPEEEGEEGNRMPPPKPVPDWRGLKKIEERIPDWQLALQEKK